MSLTNASRVPHQVSSKSLRKARLDALSAKIFTPCVACTAYGHRCSGFRPCSSCIKHSRQCIRTVPKGDKDPDKTRSALIEHPLTSTTIHVNVNCKNEQASFLCSFDWARDAIMRQIRTGFCVDHLVHALACVPAIHHFAISESLAGARARAVRFIPLSRVAQAEQEYGPPRNPESHSSNPENDEDWRAERFATDMESGFVAVAFDPATGQRRSIVANAQLARTPP